jgi:biotin carboxyl carrier protein
MPATVLRVLAAPGKTVRRGETLILLEAMKMELPLRAPQDGTVTEVLCEEGQLVQPGTILVEIT